MTDNTQPEALRLAEQYDYGDPAAHGNAWKAAVCTELRRLAELEAQIEALSGVQALSAAPTTSFEKVLSAYLTEDGFIAADDIPSICNDFARLLVVMKSAVRWAPSSAYWSEQLRRYFGEDARDGIEALEAQLRAALAASPTPPAEQKAAPKAAPEVGNSGFDYKTAADFLNGKTVSDEAVRKFVAASRWAHDERAALSATLLAMHGVLTSREAEIALLKKALLEAETAPQPAPAPLSESIDQLERDLAIIGVVGVVDGHDVVRRESVLEIARRAALAAQGGRDA